MQAEIKIYYDDVKLAKSVARAVSADNMGGPKGLSICTENEGDAVVTRIEWHAGFGTFVATIDDLLFSITMAERALQGIKHRVDSGISQLDKRASLSLIRERRKS